MVTVVLAIFVCGVWAAAANAGDSPAGFWYGLDSAFPPKLPDSTVPVSEPNVGGTLGFYAGNVDSFKRLRGCPPSAPAGFNQTTFNAADANFAKGYGVGSGLYYDMGGPGADPNFDGTAAEAYAWGRTQAIDANQKWQDRFQRDGPGSLPLRILWMDLEGAADGRSHGWDSTLTNKTDPKTGIKSCDYKTGSPARSTFPPLNRQTFNGFWDYVTNSTALKPGIYSSFDFWNRNLPSGSQLGSTYEWTFGERDCGIGPNPVKWLQPQNHQTDPTGRDRHAVFFGGVTEDSPLAIAWQWHIRPRCRRFDSQQAPFQGAYDGDYDQVNTNSLPAGFAPVLAPARAARFARRARAAAAKAQAQRRAASRARASAALASPACVAGQLSVSESSSDFSEVGETYVTYTLQNTGASTCSLQGAPGFDQHHPDGSRLPALTITDDPNPPQPATLAPGGQASFFADFAACPAEDLTINPDVSNITAITLPGSSQTLSLTSAISDQCQQEDVFVSNIQSGQIDPATVPQ